MHSIDVVHEIAAITIAFLVIRAFQALMEHYFPNSEPVAAGRFLWGGPS